MFAALGRTFSILADCKASLDHFFQINQFTSINQSINQTMKNVARERNSQKEIPSTLVQRQQSSNRLLTSTI